MKLEKIESAIWAFLGLFERKAKQLPRTGPRIERTALDGVENVNNVHRKSHLEGWYKLL